MEDEVRRKWLFAYECLQSMENAPEAEGWYLVRKEEKEYIARLKREESDIVRQWCSAAQDTNALWIPTEAAWDGDVFVEIYTKYANTFKGKRMPIEEVKNTLLPNISEALHSLHVRGIVHGGICSERIAESESGILLLPAWVRTSEEADAAAKDASAEDDYAALGRVIRELCGDCDDISVARLVYALTFIDPKRRWGYDEVRAWLNGESVNVPFSCEFLGEVYYSAEALADAMSEHWREALQTENILSALRLCAWNISEASEERMKNVSADCALCELLYILQPKRKDFPWHGIRYADKKRLGEDMLANGKDFADLLEYGMLSEHIHAKYAEAEAQWHTEPHALVLCRTAYALGAKKRFVLSDGSTAESMSELRDALQKAFAQSQEDFARLCACLSEGNRQLNPRFQAWLEAIGQENAIRTWKNQSIS